MKKIIGLGLTAYAVYWAFTTKNEIVQALMFPVKMKLGLVKKNKSPNELYKETKDSPIVGAAVAKKNEYNAEEKEVREGIKKMATPPPNKPA